MFAGAQLGANVWIATPPGYEPDADADWLGARIAARKLNASFTVTHDPELAASDADVVYTDVWASMGQEAEAEKRKKIFAPYQVNARAVRPGQCRTRSSCIVCQRIAAMRLPTM